MLKLNLLSSTLSSPPPAIYRGAEVIQHQIEEREQQRLLDSERKDQETQALLQYLEKLQEEDMENYLRKREAQQALMEEVSKCNEVHRNLCILNVRYIPRPFPTWLHMTKCLRRENGHVIVTISPCVL